MICLSFDTDHLNERRLMDFLETHPFPGRATIFCHQPFDCLSDLEHELAPHPCLAEGADWLSELAEKRQMLPAATGWRSHSCVFSHILARWLGENGYQYVSVDERFGEAGIWPTRHPLGAIWQLPVYYMDTFDISRQRFWTGSDVRPFDPALIDKALRADGIHVFDFHPIHVMLNTPDPEFYFAARERYRAGEPIESLRYNGYGVGVFLQALCEQMRAENAESVPLAEALAVHLAKLNLTNRNSRGV
jgi:hypothetical protein